MVAATDSTSHDFVGIDEGISENVRKCPDDENRLNDKQWLAIELLASGKSYSDIGRALEVDPRTIYRWRKQSEFRDALDERREEIWSTCGDRIRSMIAPSIEVIAEQLADRFRPNRFRAAATLLRLTGIREALKLEERP